MSSTSGINEMPSTTTFTGDECAATERIETDAANIPHSVWLQVAKDCEGIHFTMEDLLESQVELLERQVSELKAEVAELKKQNSAPSKKRVVVETNSLTPESSSMSSIPVPSKRARLPSPDLPEDAQRAFDRGHFKNDMRYDFSIANGNANHTIGLQYILLSGREGKRSTGQWVLRLVDGEWRFLSRLSPLFKALTCGSR
jgi:hypothetical protein